MTDDTDTTTELHNTDDRSPEANDDPPTDEGPTSSDGGPRLSRRAALTGIGLAGLLGAAGTASADPQGQVGASGDPLKALYANELNGGVTGNTSLTGLTGDGLAIDAGSLSAAPARPDVDDGTTSVADVAGLTFASGFTLTDDNDGTVTVGLDTRYRTACKIIARDGDDDDRFGRAVALSGDGTTALVGAWKDEDPNGSEAGSAYVFDASGGWSQTTKLAASDGDSFDQFGKAVALSGDGTTALVGAWKDEDPNGFEAGSAYVYYEAL